MKPLAPKRLAILAVATVTTLMAVALPVRADDLTALAHKTLIEYTNATLAGPNTLAPMLAPEFQIMRTNGIGYDRTGYLNRGVGSIKAKKAHPEFSHEDIVATRHGDIMVVRYYLRIDLTILDRPVKKRAPRLTVFRNVDGAWKVVSHSNFGAAK